METYRLQDLPAWSFGNTPEMADALLALVLSGRKTATCSALQHHVADLLPPVGSYQIIQDGRGCAACVIQNTAQFLRRFDEVDAELAAQEGEGDLSLAYWQQAHQQFFSQLGIFDTQMWLIFEQFRLVEVLQRND